MIDNQTFLTLTRTLESYLVRIPTVWDGKQAIMEMKDNGSRHWRQMEWIGFYFQYLCEMHLSSTMEMPGPQYGNASFDGFLQFPWDFKSHAMNTSNHKIIVNDSEAIANALDEFGAIGLILAMGKVTYNDEDRTFQKWHDALKGKPSAYVLKNRERGAWSRLRKVNFTLQQISFIKITSDILPNSGVFQENFRNSNAKPRRKKLLLDLEKLDDNLIHFIEFPQSGT